MAVCTHLWDISFLLCSSQYSARCRLLTDAFLGSITLNASDMAQNKENFIELTDLINEETMPNLLRAFEEDPELKGSLYGT